MNFYLAEFIFKHWPAYKPKLRGNSNFWPSRAQTRVHTIDIDSNHNISMIKTGLLETNKGCSGFVSQGLGTCFVKNLGLRSFKFEKYCQNHRYLLFDSSEQIIFTHYREWITFVNHPTIVSVTQLHSHKVQNWQEKRWQLTNAVCYFVSKLCNNDVPWQLLASPLHTWQLLFRCNNRWWQFYSKTSRL